MARQTDMFDSLFDDPDEETPEGFVVIASFRAQYKGFCNLNEEHTYKANDLVGKLERTDNPFIPVRGVCCNRCLRTTTHKRAVT